MGERTNDQTEDGLPAGGHPSDLAEPVAAAVLRSKTSAGRRSPCPSCCSRSVAAIRYGYPAPGAEEHPDHLAGEYVFGGCCILPEMPDYHCHACGFEWPRPGPRAPAGAAPSQPR